MLRRSTCETGSQTAKSIAERAGRTDLFLICVESAWGRAPSAVAEEIGRNRSGAEEPQPTTAELSYLLTSRAYENPPSAQVSMVSGGVTTLVQAEYGTPVVIVSVLAKADTRMAEVEKKGRGCRPNHRSMIVFFCWFCSRPSHRR